MFFKLVKHDHLTHYGLLWLPMAVPIGVILAAFGRKGIVPSTEGDYIGPVVMVWMLLTFMLGFARVGLRADDLAITLPLPARTLWLARQTAIVAYFLMMIAAVMLFMMAFNIREDQILIHRDAIAFLVTLLGVMLLGVALIQNLRPILREIATNRRSIACMITVWGLCLALLFVLISAGPAWSVAPFVLAGALYVRIWRKLPAAFAVVAGEPDVSQASLATIRHEGAADPAPVLSTTEWRGILRKTIVRSLYSPVPTPVVALVAAFLVFLGFYVSGFYPESLSGPVYMFWVLGISTAFIVWPANNVFRLDHLPVARRRIFPYLALPAVGMVLFGFLGGTIGGNTLSPRPPLREYLATRECSFYTRVPDRFLKVAWDGEPPAITAPWGESHEPWACRPIRGRTALMYSPYSLPAGSSREFVAWQAGRELADIYGVEVQSDDIVARFDRYFERHESGSWTVKSWGDPLRADFQGLRLRDWARPMAATVLIMCVSWFLVTAWIIYAFFSGVSPTFFSVLGRFLPPAIPVFFIAVMVWLGEYGYTTSWKLTAMANIMIRRVADLLPANPIALWAVVAAILAVFYLLAEWAFRRAQSPTGGKIQ